MYRITKKAPYGQHVALTCINHPMLRWSTKNIGGQSTDGRVWFERTIFFDLHRTALVAECDCSSSDLRLAPEYATLPDVAE